MSYCSQRWFTLKDFFPRGSLNSCHKNLNLSCKKAHLPPTFPVYIGFSLGVEMVALITYTFKQMGSSLGGVRKKSPQKGKYLYPILLTKKNLTSSNPNKLKIHIG